MHRDEYVAELDRTWRKRVMSHGRRRTGLVCWEDLEEAYNDALLAYWSSDYTAHGDDAGRLLFAFMRHACSNIRQRLSAAKRDQTRMIALGQWERTLGRTYRRIPLYEQIVVDGSVLAHADRDTLAALQYAAPETGRIDHLVKDASLHAGFTHPYMCKRVTTLRSSLVAGIREPHRGPNGLPLADARSRRGMTQATRRDYKRREAELGRPRRKKETAHAHV